MAESKDNVGTVIGADARIKGELEFEKGARLLGKLEGQVVTKGDFLVAEGAKLQGEVRAGSIRLDGEVQGNLRATDKIHLSTSAKLEGDLQTARLEVADGAVFVGRCVVGPDGKVGGDGRRPAGVAVSPPVHPAAHKDKTETPEPVGAKK
jgi:cytoskeletal protein CcmA (bactofilin family)